MAFSALTDPPTEWRTSKRFDVDNREMVMEREFWAHGTLDEVRYQLGWNAALPRIGDPLPVSLLGGFYDWRLRVRDISVTPDPQDMTRHHVIARYSTRAVEDPYAPEVTLTFGTEPYERFFDDSGNPVLPKEVGEGFMVNSPVIDLIWTESLANYGAVTNRLLPYVDYTNSGWWMNARPGQWIFLGCAGAAKWGEGTWRVSFQFRGLPSVMVGKGFWADQRAKYYYYWTRNADGSANTLQRVVQRPDVDFEALFSSQRIV